MGRRGISMEPQGGTLKTLRKMKVRTSAGSHSCCFGGARETVDLNKKRLARILRKPLGNMQNYCFGGAQKETVGRWQLRSHGRRPRSGRCRIVVYTPYDPSSTALTWPVLLRILMIFIVSWKSHFAKCYKVFS